MTSGESCGTVHHEEGEQIYCKYHL